MANSRYSTFLLASSPRFPPAAHSIFTRERTHPSININRRSHSEALSVQLVYGHLSDFPIRDDDSYKKKNTLRPQQTIPFSSLATMHDLTCLFTSIKSQATADAP